jgi:uncharacterized SAM-binding protein YcdF (DUF218 family)
MERSFHFSGHGGGLASGGGLCHDADRMAENTSRFVRTFRQLVWLAAVLFVLQMLGAIIGLPRPLCRWLNALDLQPNETPRTIVVLGGGGVPSMSTLIRLYYAAELGRGCTGTTFIVSLPADEKPDEASVGRMRNELIMRGIPESQIRMETRGTSTRQQAVNTRSLLGDEARHQPLVVVSSHYHVRRAVLAFRAVGFTRVRGLFAGNIEPEADLGWFTGLRYGVWNTWAHEPELVRELIAFAAYKLRGWV